MFQKGKIANQSGVIIIIVMMIIMVISIVSMTIFSQSMSQSKTSHAQVDQIVLEELAKGAFWVAYNNAVSIGTLNYTPNHAYKYNVPTPLVINGHSYSASVFLCETGYIFSATQLPDHCVLGANSPNIGVIAN